jgi:hypothetical protein
MNKIKFESRINARKSILLGFLMAILNMMSCSSGPVTTEINANKNLVVQKPKDYQSPMTAIKGLSAKLESSKDKELKNMLNSSLKALVLQQKSVAGELNTTGKLQLKPGFSYEFTLESFCVHSGAVRPIKGDGLFLGDVEGVAKNWLPQILSQYKSKNIIQNEAQVLIWSLISGSRFDELNSENRKNLTKIFPDAAVRFGNSFVEDSAKSFLLSQIPSEILSAKEKFDDYKNLLQDSKSKYSEIEQILSPESSRLNPIPVGWLKHEDGYYIQLKSDGYQKVHVQIYAPEGLNPNTYFNPSRHVVLPGEGQRLALSSYVIDEANSLLGDFASDIVKLKTGHTLTESEKQLILKYPIDALKMHEAMSEAFKKSGNNLKGIEYYENYKGSNFEEDLIKSGLEKVKYKELIWLI